MSSSGMVSELPTTRHFFKVMMPGFRTKLLIPVAFCTLLKRERSEKAVLTSVKGSWLVNVSKGSKGEIDLREGWEDFVRQHDLNIGDFVVFEHKGHMAFDVSVFDRSACEKEFPISNNLADKRKRTAGELSSHDQAKHFKGKTPLEAAAAYASGSPHFITKINVCNSSAGRRFVHVNVPKEFARSNGLTWDRNVTLRDPSGKEWPVKLKIYYTVSGSLKNARLEGGWHDFCASKKLKKGDVCIFQLNRPRRRTRSQANIMDVRIFPS